MATTTAVEDDDKQSPQAMHSTAPTNDFTKDGGTPASPAESNSNDNNNSSTATRTVGGDDKTDTKQSSTSLVEPDKDAAAAGKEAANSSRHPNRSSSNDRRSRHKKHHRSRPKHDSRSRSRSRHHSRSRSKSKSKSRSHSNRQSASIDSGASASRVSRRNHKSDGAKPSRSRSRDDKNPYTSRSSRHNHRRGGGGGLDRSLDSGSDTQQASTYANALKGSNTRTYNIFVKNLPKTCDKQDLIALFERFGTIFSCAVIKRRKNPTSKCFGFVNFSTREAQQDAVRASGKIHTGNSTIECEMSSNVTVVYMGNLPLDVSEADVRYHVRYYGDRYKALHIRHGHCFIVYDSYYAADRAIQSLQNTMLNGSPVWVAIASETKAKMLSSSSENPTQRSLFIGNLTNNVTEDELRERFEKYGRITSVRVPRVRGARELRGFAFVEFDNSGDAEMAMRGENGTQMHSKAITIDWCRESLKTSGPRGTDNSFSGSGASTTTTGGARGHSGGGASHHHSRLASPSPSSSQHIPIMPQLDAKTLESLPVMEIRPGKFVKVIPASFMQSVSASFASGSSSSRPSRHSRDGRHGHSSSDVQSSHHHRSNGSGGSSSSGHRRSRRTKTRSRSRSRSRTRSKSRHSRSKSRSRSRSSRRHRSSRKSTRSERCRDRDRAGLKKEDSSSSRRKHQQRSSDRSPHSPPISRSRSKSMQSARSRSRSVKQRKGRSKSRGRSKSGSVSSSRSASHRRKHRDSHHKRHKSDHKSDSRANRDDTSRGKTAVKTDFKEEEDKETANGADIDSNQENAGITTTVLTESGAKDEQHQENGKSMDADIVHTKKEDSRSA